jgi:hypothetical protein
VTLGFEYKAVRKSVYIKAQNKKDKSKVIDYILSKTLWHTKLERFWTPNEINKGFTVDW